LKEHFFISPRMPIPSPVITTRATAPYRLHPHCS